MWQSVWTCVNYSYSICIRPNNIQHIILIRPNSKICYRYLVQPYTVHIYGTHISAHYENFLHIWQWHVIYLTKIGSFLWSWDTKGSYIISNPLDFKSHTLYTAQVYNICVISAHQHYINHPKNLLIINFPSNQFQSVFFYCRHQVTCSKLLNFSTVLYVIAAISNMNGNGPNL